MNQSISICALKRYAADGAKGRWKQAGRREPDTGKRVAVVGAGPAGLTAAFYLRKKGHAVTVFEAQRQAGGMLHYGIPEYRLPRPVLDDELQSIWDAGVEFKPNQTLGEDFTLGRLKQNGYEAVFLGVGAQLSRRIPLEGCNLTDVLWGVDFLRQVAQGEKVRLKDKVVVIGGGKRGVRRGAQRGAPGGARHRAHGGPPGCPRGRARRVAGAPCLGRSAPAAGPR